MSQNARGLRREENLESVIELMIENSSDDFLLQEVWTPENKIETIRGNEFFYHGLNKKHSRRG